MDILPAIMCESPSILIKNKRLRLQMSQKELANALGMPKYGDRSIRRWEENGGK